MIYRLHIRGMAIIDSLSIDFSTGFNVITGETGAGKSILIRALSFLLGQKASSDVVRQGYEQATVSGEFFLPLDHDALTFLNVTGIPFEKEDKGANVNVRRQVSSKGRSSAWINDIAVTGQVLKELGLHLVDIFGQHDNQKLMRPEFHLSYVDKFLLNQEARQEFQKCYKNTVESLKSLEKQLEIYRTRSKDFDYRLFRLQELEKFEPSLDDFEKVKHISESSDVAVELKEGLTKILGALENDEGSVNSALWNVAKDLSRLGNKQNNEELQSLNNKAEKIASEIDDLSYSINRLASSLDIDESSIEEAQKRVFGYQELFRKHGVKEIDSLLHEYEKLKTECLSQEEAGLKFQDQLHEVLEAAKVLRGLAEKLSKMRLKAGQHIKKSVESELSELAMPGAKFDICWDELESRDFQLDFSGFDNERLDNLSREMTEVMKGMGPEGFEKAEFMLASNPGEPVLPLLRVASGGELSRIMLALKKALVADADTCVLVFDEIDTGISGRVADVVGRKMQSLSESFQVLCISHLPQVAVYADSHFLVKKEAKTKSNKEKAVRTESTIVRLTKEESAAEIARLLSGSEVSKTSLANAKSLIQKAKTSKHPKSRAQASHA